MPHSLEDHIGGPVTEEAMAGFLVQTMPPRDAGDAQARVELLSGEYGRGVAAEVLRFGTPPDHWPEASKLDPQALRGQLITQLARFNVEPIGLKETAF